MKRGADQLNGYLDFLTKMLPVRFKMFQAFQSATIMAARLRIGANSESSVSRPDGILKRFLPRVGREEMIGEHAGELFGAISEDRFQGLTHFAM